MESSHTHHRQVGLTMSFSNQGRFRQQVRFLRRQFLQDGGLPFTNALSEGTVAQALKALDVVWLDRIYSPLVTLWVFLGHPRHPCAGRLQASSRTSCHQLQGSNSNTGSVSTVDCRARRARLNIPASSLPKAARRSRYSSSRRPTGSLRTTAEKAQAKEVRSDDETKERTQS